MTSIKQQHKHSTKATPHFTLTLELFARSRYEGRGQVIPPQSSPGVINCPFPSYVFLAYILNYAHDSSFCCTLLWFARGPYYSHHSGLFHWHQRYHNLNIAPSPMTQPFRIWLNKSHQFTKNWKHSHNKIKRTEAVCMFDGIYCGIYCPNWWSVSTTDLPYRVRMRVVRGAEVKCGPLTGTLTGHFAGWRIEKGGQGRKGGCHWEWRSPWSL